MMNLDQYLFTSGYRNPFKKKRSHLLFFHPHFECESRSYRPSVLSCSFAYRDETREALSYVFRIVIDLRHPSMNAYATGFFSQHFSTSVCRDRLPSEAGPANGALMLFKYNWV